MASKNLFVFVSVVALATMWMGAFSQTTLEDIVATCLRISSEGTDKYELVSLSDMMDVICETKTDGGGWLVIMRRNSGVLRFFRSFHAYKWGFGNIKVDGEFWMGSEWIHRLTFRRNYELIVDMVYNGKSYFSRYNHFKLLSADTNYTLDIGGWDPSSTAGDNLKYANNMPFTAKDSDNDKSRFNCATRYHSAGWFKACHLANIFGNWHEKDFGRGVNWLAVTGHKGSLESIEMKIRPLS